MSVVSLDDARARRRSSRVAGSAALVLGAILLLGLLSACDPSMDAQRRAATLNAERLAVCKAMGAAPRVEFALSGEPLVTGCGQGKP